MKKINFILFAFIATLLLSSCNTNTKAEQDLTSILSSDIDSVLICILEENIDVIQDIDDAAFMNDSTFFIISNKQLINYNTTGEQMQVFNNTGSGPHEYITPSLIQINDPSVFVWCNTSLKLLEFDSNGNFKNVITNYKKAIKTFKVYQDKYIFFYKSNSAEQGVIDIYDIKENRVIKSVGEFSEEDILLLLLASKPEIIIHDNYAYFIKPASLKIFRFDLDNFNLETVSNFDDKDFSVAKVDDAVNLINTQRMEAFDYLHNNSISDNLFLINDGLIIKSEVGKYIVNEAEQRMERDKRFNKFFFYSFSESNNNNVVWKTKMNPNLYNYINYNNHIYIIENTMYNEVEKSKMYKIEMF